MSFLSPERVHALRAEFGTPVYVYDQQTLEASARALLAFPNAYGLTARYAMKALSTAAILRVMTDAGLDIDASSGFEADRALRAGIAPERIQITAQQLPDDLELPRARGLSAGQPRPGIRTQQPHQHRWPLVELWHLARAARPCGGRRS